MNIKFGRGVDQLPLCSLSDQLIPTRLICVRVMRLFFWLRGGAEWRCEDFELGRGARVWGFDCSGLVSSLMPHGKVRVKPRRRRLTLVFFQAILARSPVPAVNPSRRCFHAGLKCSHWP